MDNTKEYAWEVVQFNGTEPAVKDDEIASEWPLTIVLNGDEFATMVCSPMDVADLLTGFLAAEGIIRFQDEITSMSVDEYKGFAYITVNTTLDDSRNDHSKRLLDHVVGKAGNFILRVTLKRPKRFTVGCPFLLNNVIN